MENCPHCQRELEVALQHIPDGKAISYICTKCREEFYVCVGGQLLTRNEFWAKKKAFNE